MPTRGVMPGPSRRMGIRRPEAKLLPPRHRRISDLSLIASKARRSRQAFKFHATLFFAELKTCFEVAPLGRVIPDQESYLSPGAAILPADCKSVLKESERDPAVRDSSAGWRRVRSAKPQGRQASSPRTYNFHAAEPRPNPSPRHRPLPAKRCRHLQPLHPREERRASRPRCHPFRRRRTSTCATKIEFECR